MELFGIEFKKRSKRDTEKETLKSVVTPTSDDGAIDVISGSAAGFYGTHFNMDTPALSEAEEIKRYRDISMMSDVDMAIEDIVNEAIANLDQDPPVSLDLRGVKLSDNIKKKIEDEFQNVCNMMDMQGRAQDYFRRWYVDGRLYFHKVVDTERASEGIKDIRYIDPRKIKKIREIKKEKDKKSGVDVVGAIEEYYAFDEKGIMAQSKNSSVPPSNATKLSTESITYVPSGLLDPDSNMVISNLRVALKPANQLRMMENALVIYRLARAPERRVFYVDTGKLPKLKAEQYVKDIMMRYRNKITYDSAGGTITEDKRFMSMLEDFWLPRQEGSTGTEVKTLPGGENLGRIEDILFFQKRLYQSLKVPVSRLEQQGGLNFGRAAEINRDELKFVKFVNKLRRKFQVIIEDPLRTQLVLKGIITEDDWDTLRAQMKVIFAQDAYFAETKQQEIIRGRVELLNDLSSHIGTFFSKNYVRKKILNLTDDEIAEIEAENVADPVAPVEDLEDVPPRMAKKAPETTADDPNENPFSKKPPKSTVVK